MEIVHVYYFIVGKIMDVYYVWKRSLCEYTTSCIKEAIEYKINQISDKPRNKFRRPIDTFNHGTPQETCTMPIQCHQRLC